MRVDCTTPDPVEGSVRLRGGFGSPCDPIHSGFVEIFHRQEWGSICRSRFRFFDRPQVAGVVCRQLGFPHGTLVDPSPNPRNAEADYSDNDDEAEEPLERFWLSSVTCSGPEDALNDCDLGRGYRTGNAGCSRFASRLTVACRSFAVSEALENVTTLGAGASAWLQVMCCVRARCGNVALAT